MNKLTLLLLSFFAVLFTNCNKTKNLNIDFDAVYVVNGKENYIDVITISDHKHRNHIKLNDATFPHHIYLNESKTKLAVAITGTDLSGGHAGHGSTTSGFKVLILDTKTGDLIKELPLNKMPHNAVFSLDETELWVGQSDASLSQIQIYNSTDWSVKGTIDVGKGLSEVTFSTDGKYAFGCNTTDATVSIINTSTKSVISTTVVGKDPVGAWPASNGFVYVDNETSQTISAISTTSLTVEETINLGFKPGYVAYNSDNKELWVSDATNGRVVYFIFNNSNSVWENKGNIKTGDDAHAIVFTKDNKTAYVSNQGANTVSVIDVGNHSVTKSIKVGKAPNGMAIKQ